MPFVSMAQEVVPYPKSDIKVDWVRGTDFSKFKAYAWGPSHLATPSLEHTVQGLIDAALQKKGLQKVGMDASPSLLVAFSGGNKLLYSIQGFKNVKQGTLVVQLADPQSKAAVWWGIWDDPVADTSDKYVAAVQRTIPKMFKKYPPPTKNNALSVKRLVSCVTTQVPVSGHQETSELPRCTTSSSGNWALPWWTAT